MTLARKQTSIIHVAKAQLGLAEEDYRALLQRAAGVGSSRELDGWGFNAVMAEFERLGFRSGSKRHRPSFGGQRAGMASDAQVYRIRTLWGEFTGGQGDDASLGKWLERQFKVSALRFLPAEKVPKVMAALKAMVARKQRATPDG